MINPDTFLTTSLRGHPAGASITRALAAALDAVDPYAAVLRSLRRTTNALFINDQKYDLAALRRVWVVGAGKAAYPMARAAANLLGDRLAGGLVIVKDGYAPPGADLGPIQLCPAAHPLPDERGVQATRRIAALLRDVAADDLVLCLISGGGSALLTSPAASISLANVQAVTSALLACGATINEINTVRKHIDLVKGGGLARWAAPARVAALILSDVIGDPLDVIASGPCVPDSSTFAAAWAVFEQYGLLETIPPPVLAHLRAGLQGEIPETPKPGDALFERVQNAVIAGNYHAAQAAMQQARRDGWQTLLLTTFLQGEARQAGRMLAALARQVSQTGEPLSRPACLVLGGETTVTLRGSGLGGRNQELALAAVAELAGLPAAFLVTLATDGGDGPTDAAGAVVTGETLARARTAGLLPEDFLSRNDAYHFFQPLGDLLLPGPTQTNVNDLAFLFLF